MITRASLEKPIALTFTLLGVWVSWQAVRFCQGNAPIPGLEQPAFDERFNSGKRIRFIGSVKKADGSPLKAAPTKFIPAQVWRRMAA